MKSFLTFCALGLALAVPAHAALDGFYSSVNELKLILDDADNLREKLGTAYRLESVVSRPDGKGYLLTAKTNRGVVCTADVKVVYTPNPDNYWEAPKVNLQYDAVVCK